MKEQLENILLSLREWFQDAKMEPSFVQMRIAPEDWPTFDKIVWGEDEGIQPNVCIGFCGFNFRPAGLVIDKEFEERLLKCESLQRLVGNICGKLDNYFEAINAGALDRQADVEGAISVKQELAVVQKVRRELSILGPALDALHRAFKEQHGHAAVKYTTKESNRKIDTTQGELHSDMESQSGQERSQP